MWFPYNATSTVRLKEREVQSTRANRPEGIVFTLPKVAQKHRLKTAFTSSQQAEEPLLTSTDSLNPALRKVSKQFAIIDIHWFFEPRNTQN